jgi:hypothetical protein
MNSCLPTESADKDLQANWEGLLELSRSVLMMVLNEPVRNEPVRPRVADNVTRRVMPTYGRAGDDRGSVV